MESTQSETPEAPTQSEMVKLITGTNTSGVGSGSQLVAEMSDYWLYSINAPGVGQLGVGQGVGSRDQAVSEVLCPQTLCLAQKKVRKNSSPSIAHDAAGLQGRAGHGLSPASPRGGELELVQAAFGWGHRRNNAV